MHPSSPYHLLFGIGIHASVNRVGFDASERRDMSTNGQVPPEQLAGHAGASPVSPTFEHDRDAIDQFGDGYYELDANFRYRRVNPVGEGLAQKRREEMLGRSVTEVFPEVATSDVHRAVIRVRETRVAEAVEVYY